MQERERVCNGHFEYFEACARVKKSEKSAILLILDASYESMFFSSPTRIS